MKQVSIALIALLFSPSVFAQDNTETAPELREAINCFPAKGIVDFVSKFEDIEPDKRDSVDMLFTAKFTVNDGGVLPERIFIRHEGVETNFLLNEDGSVPDFNNIGKAPETAELCSEDPSRIGTPKGGEDMSFSISNDVYYLENSGYHDISTLRDGLKDGKSHYKKMVPAAMRMLVPSFKYVMIEYDVEGTTPQYQALKGDEAIEGLTHISFCEVPMIKLRDLEAMGADGLKIMGGAYNLTPVPGPKALKRFVGCSKDEEPKQDE